ncbi:hypothetical protein J2W32_005440 [Variovorax boronicumulans]|uniref:Nucleotidyl transferase AbiEii/AbiGii toxin family protein n=1 Tax=Variovorax boronicumulans TaxID=436515 RepID=A0AAW8D6C4_9BURK|nr:nucleotidyl transferase AbiEii/AbiGii toxin family protein [Variovorax boronicumulans]MDP9896318.1 hypothetical protein [Variovorax boronicumulans]MDQ0056372.1 hypothetical protein [Variovorax boronicumulans]
MTKVDFTSAGPWRGLWPKALGLMSHLERVTVEPQRTFGGGTVLMLRFDHRFSKDIDLFVPDLQYLGHVNQRLGGPAEELTSEYEENAEFIKLQLPEGEIDVVAGAPLTKQNFELRGLSAAKANFSAPPSASGTMCSERASIAEIGWQVYGQIPFR